MKFGILYPLYKLMPSNGYKESPSIGLDIMSSKEVAVVAGVGI